MTGLLTTQGEASGFEVGENVPVPHLRRAEGDARLLHREFESEVAHHRGDEGVLAQLPVLLHRDRQYRHDLIPVDDRALRIHREAPVGVPVVGEPEVRTVFDDRLPHLVDVRGSAPVVDVVRVRLIVDGDDLGTRGPVGERCHLVGRPVRTVDDDPDSRQVAGDGLGQVLQVPLLRIVRLLEDPSDPVPGRSPLRQSGHRRLDLVLDLIGEFVPARGEELDAVVRHRIVRGGDHHAHVRAVVVGEERHRRCGQDADPQDIDALARHARGECRGEHLPRDPGVAADDGHRAAFGGAVLLGQDMSGSHSESERKRRRQCLVRQSAYTVSSEESSHVSIMPVGLPRYARRGDPGHRWSPGGGPNVIPTMPDVAGHRSGPGECMTPDGTTKAAAPTRVGSGGLRVPRPARENGSEWDQRFEYCGARRALCRPAFLRSTARASRVRKPAFFSASRSAGL